MFREKIERTTTALKEGHSLSASLEYDPKLGLSVARLDFKNKRNPAENISAAVLPLGASLAGLTYGGEPVIHFDEGQFRDRGIAPPWKCHFFPSMLPGRHRGEHEMDGSRNYWIWDGRIYSFDSLPQRVPDHPYLIHSLQNNQLGMMQRPVSGELSASVTTVLPWTNANEHFDVYPFPHLTAVTTSITEKGLQNRVKIINTGNRNMPIQFGDHPYFVTYPDSRLVLPSTGLMRTGTDMIPTGEITPIPGDLDFNDPAGKKLEGLKLDHTFVRKRGENPYILHPSLGIRVDIEGFEQNSTVQVFRFADSDFAAVELVSPANSYNLFDRALRTQDRNLQMLTRPALIRPNQQEVFAIRYNLSHYK